MTFVHFLGGVVFFGKTHNQHSSPSSPKPRQPFNQRHGKDVVHQPRPWQHLPENWTGLPRSSRVGEAGSGLFVCLFACLFVCSFVCLFVVCLFVCSFVRSFIRFFIIFFSQQQVGSLSLTHLQKSGPSLL